MGSATVIVVDTSALIAVFVGEVEHARLENVLATEECAIPAPVLLEFALVTNGSYAIPADLGAAFIVRLLESSNIETVEFRGTDAEIASKAATTFGKGRGHPAQLNILDLQVYGIAKRLHAPILCTGRDFAATDIAIHPASRIP